MRGLIDRGEGKEGYGKKLRGREEVEEGAKGRWTRMGKETERSGRRWGSERERRKGEMKRLSSGRGRVSSLQSV